MAANEGDETAPRGNEWEVVALTASAYAAAPGPEQIDLNHDSQGNLDGENNEVESSNPMFMSSHFVFPPSQHENLPLEPEFSETNDVNDDKGGEFDIPQLAAEDGDSQKGVIFDKEKSVSSSAEFQSSHFDATVDKFNTVVEGERTDDIQLPQDSASDSGFLNFQKPAEEESCDYSNLPCEAWWKRRAVSLYAHAKEANSFWSIFITAAVMGLVIIGHQWQRERRQVLHLKWYSGVTDN